MRVRAAVLPLIAAAQMAATPVMAAPAGGHMLWADICGQPGMRVAIPLKSDGSGGGDSCPGACHAALCRKWSVASGARGARI
jgi:hypothetical protein